MSQSYPFMAYAKASGLDYGVVLTVADVQQRSIEQGDNIFSSPVVPSAHEVLALGAIDRIQLHDIWLLTRDELQRRTDKNAGG